MNKAVFLDRDGVINQERGDYSFLPEHFVLNLHIIDAITLLQSHGFLVIVVSNQGGIAKKRYSNQDVEYLHELLQHELQKNHTQVDEFYYCPHHSNVQQCLCRKPQSLMLEKAIARFQIDPNQSYCIGDSQRDIESAERVGVNGILIKSNEDILPYVNQIINVNK